MLVEDAPGAFSAVNKTSLAGRRFNYEAHELLLPNLCPSAKKQKLQASHRHTPLPRWLLHFLAVQQQRQVHMPGAPVQRVTPETFHTWKQQKDEAKEQVQRPASWL